MQWRRRESLSHMFELSSRFVDMLIKEMEASGRYPKGTILRGKGYVLTEEEAFKDYLFYRTRLNDPTTGSLVAPYKQEETKGEDIYLIPEHLIKQAMG